MTEHAWEEVFRLTDIEKAILPSLPYQAQLMIAKELDVMKIDPVKVSQRIRRLSVSCEMNLPRELSTILHAQRNELITGAAQRLRFFKEKNIIDLSMQSLREMQQFSGLIKYMDMINSVTLDWSDSLQKQQESWDTMWARNTDRQRQIDQMKIDALTGTPFVKAYLVH